MPSELVVLFVTTACAAVVGIAFFGARYVNALTGTAKKLQVLKLVAAKASVVVAELDATMRPLLVASFADGKLDAAEAAKIKSVAMLKLRELLGTEGVSAIREVIGITTDGALEMFLGGALELALKGLRFQGVLPGATISTPH